MSTSSSYSSSASVPPPSSSSLSSLLSASTVSTFSSVLVVGKCRNAKRDYGLIYPISSRFRRWCTVDQEQHKNDQDSQRISSTDLPLQRFDWCCKFEDLNIYIDNCAATSLFDMILFDFSVMSFMNDTHRVLHQINRYLKPGGIWVFDRGANVGYCDVSAPPDEEYPNSPSIQALIDQYKASQVQYSNSNSSSSFSSFALPPPPLALYRLSSAIFIGCFDVNGVKRYRMPHDYRSEWQKAICRLVESNGTFQCEMIDNEQRVKSGIGMLLHPLYCEPTMHPTISLFVARKL